MGSTMQRRIARFGIFEADLDSRRLTKNGFRIRLQDQPFQVLALLLERQGLVVTRDELKEKLWASDTFVAFDDGLNTAIKKLRTALNDAADNPRFVETVPRVGYRFIAPVSISQEPAIASPHPVAHFDEESSAEPSTETQAEERKAGQGPPFAPKVHSPKNAVQRFRWAVGAGALVLVAVFGFRAGNKLKSASVPHEEFQAIAVLPLQNMSSDPAQEYIADGMTDEIITDLAKLAGPKVISRTSAMQYKGTHKSIPEIARELNVGAVVEGSVEQSGGRMRVRVQLIQASTDQHMWAEAYDRQLQDELQLEGDLAKDIAQQIQLHLTPRQQQNFANSRPTNPQAFQDYLQGRQYWAMRTDESLNKAIEYFNRAIQEDPGDARSYAGLAQCYIVLPMLTPAEMSETERKSREAAKKALSMDDSLAEAHLAIAEVEFYQDWDFPGAEKEFRRTLELNPNYSTGHQWYAEFLSVFGRHEEATREIETTLALDPLSAIVHHQAGQTFQQARQYDRAIQEYQQALKLSPNLYVSYEAMYWAYRRQGKFEQAIQAMQGSLPYWHSNSDMQAVIGQLPEAYARSGREGFVRQSIEMHKRFRDAAVYLARDYADLGDKERALQQLEQAFKNRNEIRIWILIDVELDPLRSEPRFQSLIKRIGSHRS
jgi:TolB-like protein/DNA-binding winged helix-turn-helix (wHTH) protein/Tfp pilus assembly protein PilF